MRGRVLRPRMKGWPTRPTTDLAREALYNILQHQLDFRGMRILDLFGGTGAHSLECISRGCEDVTYVDKYGKCVKWMKQVTQDLEVEDCIQIIPRDVRTFIRQASEQWDFIFADPPYALEWLGSIPDLVFEQDLLRPDGLLVLEHDNTHQFETLNHFGQSRKYGQTVFSFFRKGEE